VEAPSIRSRAIKKSIAKNGHVSFCFRGWDDLPKTHQKQHRSFANLIANYIHNEASDAFDTVHIVAAPELTLAPESLNSVVTAVETRRNAAWIVFPGSYHIEMKEGIINRAPVYIDGVLHRADLAGSSVDAPMAAVKCTPFVLTRGRRKYVEDIDGRESLTHLLDTSVGRIAVMICRDFLEENLRNEIVSMCADHLFVLSMSPDSGIKFETAMNSTSNFRTSCFFVNAFTAESPRAAHRAPLKREKVKWMPQVSEERHWTFVLEPE
jgi:hypothetical protein